MNCAQDELVRRRARNNLIGPGHMNDRFDDGWIAAGVWVFVFDDSENGLIRSLLNIAEVHWSDVIRVW